MSVFLNENTDAPRYEGENGIVRDDENYNRKPQIPGCIACCDFLFVVNLTNCDAHLTESNF